MIFVAPCRVDNVGAAIRRPRGEIFVFALVFGEIATLYRRATNGRPYNIIDRLRYKLKFELPQYRIGRVCQMWYTA